MKCVTDFVWDADRSVTLTACSEASGEKRPVMLVLPGGGYEFCADVEGAPVAERFDALGWCSFVLNYSTMFGSWEGRGGAVNPHSRFPEPLLEVGAAMRYIRENAERFGADGERIVLAGFSAGGHLAGCYMNLWNTLAAEPLDKPAACVLVYAAVDLPSEQMMMDAVFGADAEPAAEELARYMPCRTVSADTPPCFIVHSVPDPMVPVQQSVELSAALDAAGVVYEMHLFGCGGHAYGAGDRRRVGAWTELAHSFLTDLFAKPRAYDKDVVRKGFGL